MKFKNCFFALLIGAIMLLGGCKKDAPEPEKTEPAAETFKEEAKADPEAQKDTEKEMEALRKRIAEMQKEIDENKKKE